MTTQDNLARKIDAAQHHILFQHNPQTADGWIAIAKKDHSTGRFTQQFYQPTDLAEHLTTIIGEDVFFSQNTFYRKSRRIETVRQLRSLYVDLDCYNCGMRPTQALFWLEEDYFRRTIPEPNMIIFSGQGLVLIWNIEPVPYMALPLWQAVQTYLIGELKDLGGDTKASDAARIFRLAGTISSKNGSEVSVQYRHDYKYTLRDIQEEYLPELVPKKQESAGRKKKIVHLFNVYSLHGARLQDLNTLVTIRNGEMTNYRETTLFLYRYWCCCFENDPETALQHTLDFNKGFTYPLPESEVIRATRSAEKAYKAKSDKAANERAQAMGYPGAGYRISNAKIIDWLDISEDEQKHLKTIIGTKEKNRRKRLAYHANPEPKKQAVKDRRRKNGMKAMEDYNAQRKQQRDAHKEQVRALLQENPKISIRQMAERLTIGKSQIAELRKEILTES